MTLTESASRLGALGATPRQRAILALAAGGLVPVAFAPFGLFPLAALLPAILFAIWHECTAREAARLGFLFGLGMFGAGVSWIFFSLHDFGNMPAVMAAAMVLLFVMLMASYPALLGYLQARIAARRLALVIFTPAGWVLLEWVRGWMLTGFPWLNLGYSQIESPLASVAPVGGVYLVSYLVVLSATLLVYAWRVRRWLPLIVIAVIWSISFGLGRIQWVGPVDGPLRASLIQANVPIEVKWQPEWRQRILDTYTRLSFEQEPSRLIVWPETAAPAYLHDLQPGFLPVLREHLAEQDAALLFGVVERVAANPHSRLYNSVTSVGGGTEGTYRKQHLVPFGEYLPLSDLLSWLLDYLQIPMSNFDAWDSPQAPLTVAGQNIAVSICYEDVFGEEIIRALPSATLLVNVSEDSWFGNSLAPHQHLEIARMRALETGRSLLRATNTGVSAIIDHRGRIVTSAPQFKTAVVTSAVQPMQGATPYVRVGNWPVITFVMALTAGMLLAWRTKRR